MVIETAYRDTNSRGNNSIALELAHSVIESIEDKMGASIVLIDLSGMSAVADYFVIATAQGERQLKALARGVAEAAGKEGRIKLRDLNVQAESGWVLVDVGEVIVHLFTRKQRDYYGLEKLWSDGKVLLSVQ